MSSCPDAFKVTAIRPDGLRVDIAISPERAAILAADEDLAVQRATVAAIIREWRADDMPGIPYHAVSSQVKKISAPDGPPGTATIARDDGGFDVFDIDSELLAQIRAIERREEDIDADTPMPEIFDIAAARSAVEAEIVRRWERSDRMISRR